MRLVKGKKQSFLGEILESLRPLCPWYAEEKQKREKFSTFVLEGPFK